MVEIFKKNEAGIKIESIDEEIDYRSILMVLTAKGYVYENTVETVKSSIKELEKFFTEIIKEGQKNREIRQDIPSDDIAESLIFMYWGIEYRWEMYIIEDMISAFEDSFNLECEKIRFKG